VQDSQLSHNSLCFQCNMRRHYNKPLCYILQKSNITHYATYDKTQLAEKNVL